MLKFIKNLFSKKAEKGEEEVKISYELYQSAIDSSIKKEKELISDFIFILNDIQNELGQKGQWKHIQLVAKNKISLAIENYSDDKKIIEVIDLSK